MLVAQRFGMRDPKIIYAGTDLTHLGELAVRTALELADHFAAHRVHIVYATPATQLWFAGVGDMPASTIAATLEATVTGARRSLEAMRLPLTGARVTREVRIGPAARELAEVARELRADLGVIATHRRNTVGRLVLGSVANALVRASPSPVFVAGADRPFHCPIKEVVAAIDGSPVSLRVLQHAIGYAKQARGRVRVVSVFEVTPFGPPVGPTIERIEEHHRSQIAALVDRVRVPEVEVEIGVYSDNNTKERIIETAARSGAHLLVIGCSGHNAWERMVLGSTATHVLTDAPCPVLVVPAPARSDAADRAA